MFYFFNISHIFLKSGKCKCLFYQFYGGDGLVEKGVENTIRNIGELAKKGMRETDKTIIQIMTR